MATCECRRSAISRRFSKRRPLQRRMPRWSQRDLRWRPPGKTQRPRRSAHRLKPSTGRLVPSGSSATANHSTLLRGTICELEWIGSTPVRSEPAEEARHRRVVPMRRCSAVLTETTTIPDFRGFSSFQSPLTDSNRRPLLTIEQRGGNRGQGREAAGTEVPQEEGIARRRVTSRGLRCSRWCSLNVPLGSRLAHTGTLSRTLRRGPSARALQASRPRPPRGRLRAAPAAARPRAARAPDGRRRRTTEAAARDPSRT
jgi:hypothetical protein